MRFRAAVAVAAIAGLVSTSCKVITEQMPVSISPIDPQTAPPVTTKTPKPTPSPDGEATEPPLGGVGTPTPKKTKTPKPDEEPTNVPGCPAPWPPSCAPVARVGVVTFWILCGSQVVPNSKFASSADARCQVKL